MRITRMCLRNLLRRRVRTLLTIFAIGLAAMFIIAVGATTSRYIAVIKEMNLFFTGDVIVVARGVFVVQAFPIGGTIQEDVVDTLAAIEEVQTATPILFIPNPSKTQGTLELMPGNITIGLPTKDISVLVGPTPLRPNGSWPSVNSSQAVIGAALADKYNLTAGSTITLREHDITVTGVLETRSAILLHTIILPLKLAQKIYGYNMLINMIVVKPETGISCETLADRIESEVDGIKTLTETERTGFLQPILEEAELWNMGLRTALFLISLILITNISIINTFERRRDFATLYAIGASKLTVTRIVITETTLLGFFGGIIGTILGAISSILIVSYYTAVPAIMIFPDLLTIVPPNLIAEILSASVLIGALAGIVPAVTIGRAKLEEILRYEY